MADKQRRTFPVAVRFFDGELPTAAKFNAIANQSRQGLNILEYSVGDIWNQGGDAFLFDKEEAQLQITNIGRLLGKSANLNPYIPSLPNIGEYTYLFTSDAGNFEATLTFPPHGTTPNYVWTNSTNSSTPKATKEEVLAANDWWIDTSTGQIYSYTVIASNWTLAYCPIVSGSSYDEGTFNVIPDPDTDASYAFQSLKVESISGDNYYIYLPPRGPLATRTLTRSPIDDTSNYSSTPSSELRFWQADSVEAETGANGNHYRYNLPDILSSATTGTAIPDGFLYLWDPINKTIIEGISFSIVTTGNRWKLLASGSALTEALTNLTSIYTPTILAHSTHDAEDYPDGGFRLITVGTDLSKTVTNLVKSFLNHSHSDSNSLPGIPVPHSKLTGLFEPVVSGVTYVNSQLDNDDHPQYFHRGGSQVARDRYNNAILGDVILGSTDSTTNYNNLVADSRGLWFGKQGASSGYVRYNYVDSLTSAPAFAFKTLGGNQDIVIQTLQSTSDIRLRSGGETRVDATDDCYLTAGVDVNIQATDDVNITATNEVSIEGTKLQWASTKTLTYTVALTSPMYLKNSLLEWDYYKRGAIANWRTQDGTNEEIHFIIKDIPEGATLKSIKILAYFQGAAGYDLKLDAFKNSIGSFTDGASQSSSSLGSVTVTGTFAGEHTKVLALTGLSSSFSHTANEYLELAITNVAGSDHEIIPLAQLTIEYTQINK